MSIAKTATKGVRRAAAFFMIVGALIALTLIAFISIVTAIFN